MDGGNPMAFPPMDASFLVDGMTGLPTPPVAPVAPVAPPMAAPVLDDPMDPSALGLSPVGPAPERPTLGGQKPDSLAQIVRLAMLGLAAGMGPGRGTGLAQGMVLADQRRQQQQLQQDRIALQDYQIARSDWEQQQRQAAQEADRRGRVLMSALSNLERDLDATKSSADAERVYQMYGAALSAQGYRGYDPESLKRKFKNPDRKARAMKVVDAYMKNPVWVKVYESDPDAALEATVDLDGVGVTMREAMEIAGSGMINRKTGKALVPPAKPTPRPKQIFVTRGGRVVPIEEGTAQPGDVPYDPVAARQGAGGDGGKRPKQIFVVRNGVVTPIEEGTAQPGDRPYSASSANPQAADDAQATYGQERGRRIVESIDELLPQVSRWTVGISGALLGNVPESEARSFRAQLDTLKSNIAFNELTEMRAASKTGGALGNVSDTETRLLQNALGALDQAQSPNDFARQLRKIRASLLRWEEAKKKAGVVPMASHSGESSGAGRSVTVGGQTFGVQVIP